MVTFLNSYRNLNVIESLLTYKLVLTISYYLMNFRSVKSSVHGKTEVSNSTVRDLAMALLQIEQMLEAKYMNPPLGTYIDYVQYRWIVWCEILCTTKIINCIKLQRDENALLCV